SLQAFGGTFFSPEAISIGIALVVGIDRIMSEGRALTNATGNTVATLVIAKWQGEPDEERLHEVLPNPSLVDDVAADAMSGEDIDDDGVDDGYRGRFERRPDGA